MRFGHSLHEAGYMGLLQRMVALDGLPAGEGYAQLKLFVGAAAGAGMGEVAGADYHRQTGEQLAASPLLPTLRPHHSLESKNTLTRTSTPAAQLTPTPPAPCRPPPAPSRQPPAPRLRNRRPVQLVGRAAAACATRGKRGLWGAARVRAGRGVG